MRLLSFSVIAIALLAVPAGAATHCAVGKACQTPRPAKACKAGVACPKPAPTVPAGTVAPVPVPSGSKPLSLPAANAVLPP
jgi:hypothetical protein